MFYGFRSLCIIEFLCKNCNASKSCLPILLTSFQSTHHWPLFFLFLIYLAMSPPYIYSMTIVKWASSLVSYLWKYMYCTIFLWTRSFPLTYSAYIYLRNWSAIFLLPLTFLLLMTKSCGPNPSILQLWILVLLPPYPSSAISLFYIKLSCFFSS